MKENSSGSFINFLTSSIWRLFQASNETTSDCSCSRDSLLISIVLIFKRYALSRVTEESSSGQTSAAW